MSKTNYSLGHHHKDDHHFACILRTSISDKNHRGNELIIIIGVYIPPLMTKSADAAALRKLRKT